LTTYEEILPEIIINGSHTTEYKLAIDFLSLIKENKTIELDESSLGGVVYDFQILSQSVNELSTIIMKNREEEKQDADAAVATATEQRIDALLEIAERLLTNLSGAETDVAGSLMVQ